MMAPCDEVGIVDGGSVLVLRDEGGTIHRRRIFEPEPDQPFDEGLYTLATLLADVRRRFEAR